MSRLLMTFGLWNCRLVSRSLDEFLLRDWCRATDRAGRVGEEPTSQLVTLRVRARSATGLFFCCMRTTRGLAVE